MAGGQRERITKKRAKRAKSAKSSKRTGRSRRRDRPGRTHPGPVSPRRCALVQGCVQRSHRTAGAGLARHRGWFEHLAAGADGQRQDADRVPLVHQPPDVRGGARREGAVPRPLHLAVEGAGRRRRAQPARPARRHQPSRARGGRRAPPAAGGHPDRRHACGRTCPLHAAPGRHPDHDARVALPASDVECARRAAPHPHGHHRRDPRDGGDQARRPSRAVARAARGDRPRAHPAHRAVGDATSTRRGRPLPGGRGARARRRRPAGRRLQPARGRRSTNSSRPPPTTRHIVPSPSSMRDARGSCRCGSKCRSRTWRG